MTSKPTVGASTRARRRCRGDGGAALVEFAFIMPLLFMLILGMFTGGMAMNQKQQLTHAAREGARFAATVPFNQVFSNGESWQDNMVDYVFERAAGDLDRDNEDHDVCVSLVEGSGSAITVIATSGSGACIPGQEYPTAAGDPGRRVQVRVSRPFNIELGAFGSINRGMSSTATAKSESDS